MHTQHSIRLLLCVNACTATAAVVCGTRHEALCEGCFGRHGLPQQCNAAQTHFTAVHRGGHAGMREEYSRNLTDLNHLDILRMIYDPTTQSLCAPPAPRQHPGHPLDDHPPMLGEELLLFVRETHQSNSQAAAWLGRTTVCQVYPSKVMLPGGGTECNGATASRRPREQGRGWGWLTVRVPREYPRNRGDLDRRSQLPVSF